MAGLSRKDSREKDPSRTYRAVGIWHRSQTNRRKVKLIALLGQLENSRLLLHRSARRDLNIQTEAVDKVGKRGVSGAGVSAASSVFLPPLLRFVLLGLPDIFQEALAKRVQRPARVGERIDLRLLGRVLSLCSVGNVHRVHECRARLPYLGNFHGVVVEKDKRIKT